MVSHFTEYGIISPNFYKDIAEKGVIQKCIPAKSFRDTEYLKSKFRSLLFTVCIFCLHPSVLLCYFEQSWPIFIIHYFDGMTFSVFPDHP